MNKNTPERVAELERQLAQTKEREKKALALLAEYLGTGETEDPAADALGFFMRAAAILNENPPCLPPFTPTYVSLANGTMLDSRAVRVLDAEGYNIVTIWSHPEDEGWNQGMKQTVAVAIQTALNYWMFQKEQGR